MKPKAHIIILRQSMRDSITTSLISKSVRIFIAEIWQIGAWRAQSAIKEHIMNMTSTLVVNELSDLAQRFISTFYSSSYITVVEIGWWFRRDEYSFCRKSDPFDHFGCHRVESFKRFKASYWSGSVNLLKRFAHCWNSKLQGKEAPFKPTLTQAYRT